MVVFLPINVDLATDAKVLKKTFFQIQVDEFMPFLPVITGLRTAGMRDRHWDQLSEKLEVDLHPDDNYTLTMCVLYITCMMGGNLKPASQFGDIRRNTRKSLSIKVPKLTVGADVERHTLALTGAPLSIF